jgi:hypothetical protein
LIPAGFELTLPLPFPCRIVERVNRCVGCVTVSVVLALPEPSLAVIVVVPAATPVARPAALMVATEGLLLVHVSPPVPLTLTGVDELVVVPFPS